MYFTLEEKETERGGSLCKGRGGKVCNDVGADLGENYDNEIKGGSDKYADSADIMHLVRMTKKRKRTVSMRDWIKS